MSRAKGLRRVRGMQAGIVVFEIGDTAFEAFRGHVGSAFIPAACAVIIVLAMLWLTRKIGQREHLDRPRPDYPAIARMERELYGETFEHEGAPQARGVDPEVAKLHAMMDGLAERATALRERQPRWRDFDGDRKAMRDLAVRARAGLNCDDDLRPANLRWKAERFARRLAEGPRYPDTTVPATLDQYVAWLRGYVKRGGKVTHFYDYPFKGFRYAASSPLVVESDYEFGANSREIVVARGVETQRTEPGAAFDGWAHSGLYFMHGYRTNRPSFVPVYSDPEFDFARRD